MKKYLFSKYYLLTYLGIYFFLISCNDDEQLGIDLLNNEWLNAKGVDTFRLSANKYDYSDSLILFYKSISPRVVLTGQMQDPKFGKVNAGFVSQLSFIADKNIPVKNKVIDSIVLSLRYDTSYFYGPTDQEMSIEVRTLTKELDFNTKYNKNTDLPISNTVIGKKENFIPNKKDSVSIILNKETIKLFPQVRINMDTAVLMPILRSLPDSVFESVEYFIRDFPGINIRATKGNSIVAFYPGHSDSQLTFYYKDTDTTQGQFILNLADGNIRVPTFELDHSGTIADDFDKGQITSDSLMFMQSMIGTDLELSFKFDSSLLGKYINYAVIELYALQLPGDDISTYTPCRILTAEDITTTTPSYIRDVARGLSFATSRADVSTYTLVFGGNPIKMTVDGEQVVKYNLNITNHFINSFKERKDIRLRISPLFKTETVDRSVFAGTNHSKFRARLKLVYSE